MVSTSTDVFALPSHLRAKVTEELIGEDRHYFADLQRILSETIDGLQLRAESLRRLAAVPGQQALERDAEIHRLTAREKSLKRYGLDMCLGRMVPEGGGKPVYIGRFGLADADGEQLLVDWRSPAAEPFFAATAAHPMGIVTRRRYRWTRGRITDYWDEAFTADATVSPAALDDQSAFIASLSSSRSSTMRDVLGTIQADQDAIIRADSRGGLVVNGGPGTGKTVVALHRAAYLMYGDPRLRQGRGRVLFVGPHEPYLRYVADVLPSLGEDGVVTCTLNDLVPEASVAGEESDQRVYALKTSAAVVEAIEPAVALYEEPPTTPSELATSAGEVYLGSAEWAEAFAGADPQTPHNEARDQVWNELVSILYDKVGDEDLEVDLDEFRAELVADSELTETFSRAWPILNPDDIVADLWEVPAYLRRCAPWLDADQRALLHRADPRAWTTADLPLLDAARHRVGDPDYSRKERQREAASTNEQARMREVIDDLLRADVDHDGDVQALNQVRIQQALVYGQTSTNIAPDRLVGPFAHIIVDEAQELSDAQWQMLVRRCPAKSFTIVGDRAQARAGFTETWAERLNRIGLEQVRHTSLGINYRTPAEVMTEAVTVIKQAFPEADVPQSIRHSGIPVRHDKITNLADIVDDWLANHDEGVACVITTIEQPQLPRSPRLRYLQPELTKGLEFDLVVLVDPPSFGTGLAQAVDTYVAMTRATQELIILT